MVAAAVLVAVALLVACVPRPDSDWPLGDPDDPGAVQDVYGPRLLGGSYDFHRGVDFAAPQGTPVHPVQAGTVVRIETAAANVGTARERYGNWVLVEHAPDAQGLAQHSAYLHLHTIDVAVDQEVAPGDTLGTVGATGVGINTEHLHLTTYRGLVGTGVTNSKDMSPFHLLPTVTAELTLVVDPSAGAAVIEISGPVEAFDVTKVALTDGVGDPVLIDLESEENLCGDDPVCGDVEITPADFVLGGDPHWTIEVSGLDELTGVLVARATGPPAQWPAP